MTTEKKPTVKVEALEYHTHEGKAYEAGDTYQIAEDFVDSIVAQKKARVYDAKAEPVPAKAKAKAVPAGTAIEPLSTVDISVDKGKLHTRDMKA